MGHRDQDKNHHHYSTVHCTRTTTSSHLVGAIALLLGASANGQSATAFRCAEVDLDPKIAAASYSMVVAVQRGKNSTTSQPLAFLALST
ncbi:hypothetical protein ACH5RR_000529 [Cinchona calisaya]|uniref:Uncharacterized protein n=1 Tax=Cinchona calisaya TaxID=153742 RepID=A0ABD3B1G8_9GENT